VNNGIRKVAERYQAPTWSWAAINYPVMMCGLLQHYVPQASFAIIDVWCRVPGNNPYGRVVDACLQVRGLYLESPTLNNQDGNFRSLRLQFSQHDLYFQFYPDDIEGCLALGDAIIVPWTVLYIMRINEGKLPSSAAAIVLKRSDAKPGAFVRIGLGIAGASSEGNR
jgi:hypothetical protein